MKFSFTNLSSHLLKGMEEFAAFHGFELGKDGIQVTVTVNSEKKIAVEKNYNQISVTFPAESYIFRTMTRILSRHDEKYFYEEPVNFDTCGAMFDVSQANALLNADSCKLMLKLLAGMGYNMFMLYMEDCYKIDSEPYFGYMRPKYTVEDLREIDEYAYNLGIEMISSR